jgi:hypothetical protein
MTVHTVRPNQISAAVKATYSNHQYFDLLHTISEIEDRYLRARVSNSVAWRWDNMLVSQVRSVARMMAQELWQTGQVESLNDARSQLASKEFAEQNFEAIGSAAVGPITTFRRMLDLRNAVVGLAIECGDNDLNFRGQPMLYEDRGLLARIDEEREPRTDVSPDERRLIEKEARALYARRLRQGKPASEKYIERYISEMTAASLDNDARLTNVLKEQRPSVRNAFLLMLECEPKGYEAITAFHQLDLAVQQQLINGARDACTRARIDARTDRDMKLNFDMILDAALDFDELLENVLKAPKFKHADAQLESLEPKLERVDSDTPVTGTPVSEDRSPVMSDESPL